jgi:DNA repair exonuclease SbcCD ATPase subunit
MSLNNEDKLSQSEIDALLEKMVDLKIDAPEETHVLVSEEEHDELESHIDEKWLISYSDLMTLLFGLFVLLYSMAMKNTSKEQMDRQLKEISQELKRTPSSTQTSTFPNEFVYKLLTENKMQKQQIKELLAKLETLKNFTSTVSQKEFDELKKKVEELEKKNVELQAKLQDALKEVDSLKQENIALKEKIKELEELLKKEKKKNELLAKQVEDLKKKLEEEIKAKLAALAKITDNNLKVIQPHMMVVARWDTPKQDIDLTIEDPNQQAYNYKKKVYKDKPGEFVMDSRYGPGVEIWQSLGYVPGEYKLKLNLYRPNGNPNPAQVDLTVLTNAGTFVLPKLELSGTSKVLEKRFSITEKGEVKFLDIEVRNPAADKTQEDGTR